MLALQVANLLCLLVIIALLWCILRTGITVQQGDVYIQTSEPEPEIPEQPISSPSSSGIVGVQKKPGVKIYKDGILHHVTTKDSYAHRQALSEDSGLTVEE